MNLVSTTTKERGAGMAMSVATAIFALQNKCERIRVEDSTWKGLSERRRSLTKDKEQLYAWILNMHGMSRRESKSLCSLLTCIRIDRTDAIVNCCVIVASESLKFLFSPQVSSLQKW